MAQWSFVTQNRNGSALGDVGPFLHARELDLLLNRPSIVRASIDLNAPSAQLNWLLAGETELKVYRNGTAIETVFQLSKIVIDVGSISGTITLEWMGIASYLRDLPITADTDLATLQGTYATNDPHCVLQHLMATDLGQAYAYAIAVGTVTGSLPTKAKIWTDSIDGLTAIEQLSERADGFDFAVNTSRELDIYYPYRGSDNGLVLQYDDGGNLAGFGYEIDAGPGRIITDITGYGGGGLTSTASDTTARATYGRRQSITAYPAEVATQAALDDYVEEDLKVAKAPMILPRLILRDGAIDWDDYDLGDTVNVQLRAGSGDYVDIDDDYRIVGISVRLSELDEETISLDLNEKRLVV